jgi:hypothetical protein
MSNHQLSSGKIFSFQPFQGRGKSRLQFPLTKHEAMTDDKEMKWHRAADDLLSITHADDRVT